MAIKIQYPGVAATIDSDVETLSRLLTMTRLIPRDLDLSPTFAEVREMLHREANYRLERAFTEDYGRRLANDPRFVVPRVLGEYCGDQVLATTFEGGFGVKHKRVDGLDQDRRNHLARSMVDLFLHEFFRWHQVQSDPNFGNYRFRIGARKEDDRIVLLDFAATRRFNAAFVHAYEKIVQGALRREPAPIREGAFGIDLMRPDYPAPVLDAFARLCELLVEPFNEHARDGTPPALLNRAGQYRWAASDLLARASRAAASNAVSSCFRVPPREVMYLHRRLIGVFIMCAVLHAEFNARDLLLEQLNST